MARLKTRIPAPIDPMEFQTLSPLMRRIYAARGIKTEAELNRSVSQLIPPDTLGSLDVAVASIAHAIIHNELITVAGDYDCDGATGTTVGYRGLRLLGAQHVKTVVPDRAIHGYGLGKGLVDFMDPATKLIVTVDSGTSSVEGIAHANAKGMRVVVTDHHLQGDSLPDAVAIVNPNLIGDPFPSKTLAGVGVMFYVLLAVRRHLRINGFYRGALPDLESLLPIVAVGTVADLVPLDQNNRILVHAGLRRIRAGIMPVGLRIMLEMSKKNHKDMVASDIAFSIAPILNAAGRIKDMAIGVEALCTDDEAEAQRIVTYLLDINAERKEMQAGMVEEAEELTKTMKGEGSNGVTVFSPGWHAGIVGLVASKLKESMHRPVFALAPSQEGSQELRGSGRSIPGIHLRDALVIVDTANPGLLPKFGGHAMAAGLSLHIDRVEDFSKAFEAAIASMITPEMLEADIMTDGTLTASELTLETAEQLRKEGPWGQAFPEPVFEGEFIVTDYQILKDKHLKYDLMPVDGRSSITAIHFFSYTGQQIPNRVRAAYEMSVNEFRDRRSLQLLIRHLEPVG